ncbi:chromosome segregation protein SMC [Glaciecola sp. 33A]|jgi:chromosome segregation protein|uniref:chromosome segregation protein SMC n=1 Tax=Glaciecola sp. 33A TaxID=2057807 RepID=UPI000C346CD0|nr:chromosome segregation protein SMC [Glaciecola sp. 33A]PKI00027.1 chromosome segregation protein SMC [Glaciecola sp. 33A]
MRLKKIKLAGFKSFVDPTTIPFPGEMTAVVGPNGCGKSNVIDAVRWVLGESSAKNLRGDAMTDVIFNGSTARKALSQCSVELIFDNSSGRVGGEYANYNELSVKRTVTKQAISSYLLNGTKCRKRDITDLFLGTGLGPRSYAIIEQGMISKLIESRPQELRVFVEEAAGISKYKERRRETENRIKHTKENLERLDDVRNELGEQLSKLQRQSVAAIRYKELKASERELKAQLAVFRWLKQINLINQVEANISEKEIELEKIIAQKRGDESSIIQYREEQESCKFEINDIQQEIFKVSTNITQIEQSQLFSKKRKHQIQLELQQLQTQAQHTEALFADTAQELVIVQDELVDLEPKKMILEEAVENAQAARRESEKVLLQFNEKNREGEIQYHALKQELQSCHSQIQNTMSMQLRTDSRIQELKQELAEFDDEYIKQQTEDIQTDLLLVNEGLEQAKKDVLFIQQRQHKAALEQGATRAEVEKQNGLMINLQASKDALQNIQKKSMTDARLWPVTNEQYEFETQLLELSAFLEVTPGYEGLCEIVFSHIASPKVIPTLSSELLESTFFDNKHGQALLFEKHMTGDKVSGSLAEKINNPSVPQFLNLISLVDDVGAALTLQKYLRPGHSVLTPCGLWLFSDMLINGAGEQVDASISRAAEVGSLKIQIEVQRQNLNMAEKGLKLASSSLDGVLALVDDAKSICTDYTEQAFKLSTQLSQFQQQIAQQVSRHERFYQELERQQINAQEELERLEELNEQVEIHAMDLAQIETFIDEQVTHTEVLQANVQLARTQVEQLVTRTHELAMQVQQTKNKYNLLKDKQITREEQISENKEKIAILQEEAQELSMPFEDQQVRLQVLLENKSLLQTRQQQIHLTLTRVDEKLLEAEKGQSGINQAAENTKAEIDSMKLQAEGSKVRAQSYLEQLQEMEQALKPLLESLPDDIEEEQWQQNLEKTASSLTRLGAVNLAAVEEFESQSIRKRYLDEQNDDLTQALETLGAAIKKIDKETRTRFKATFDQINSDLKILFPKVFGGGSAHLALTEDDMLDTGVTIMARPPGKKNSTIHLLSGGEKALTALSLVFAIFRLNPAPFCLLDEVDAPLDDANVGRFCKLVSEMSKTVQFIYITHNKVAMEMASHLTGVTMSEPGVSRMVAVDVEEALAIAE